MKIVLQKKDNWNSQFRHYSRIENISSDINNLTDYVAMGCFDFVNFCKQKGATVFCSEQWFQYSYYSSFFGDELLNRDYVLLPASEFSRLKFEILQRFGKDCKIFVRPNEGTKLFTGMLLDITEFDSFSEEYNNELIVVAKPQEIIGEWRFVISEDAGILGVSLYRYDNNNVYVASCSHSLTDYVEQISKNIKIWPDKLLTIDVAQITSTKYAVVECNGFSTSGLYEMKPEKIIDYIGKM